VHQALFYLRIEGISITESIKIKAALHMVEMLEASKLLKPGGKLIESSSGNLGLALSMICAARGYEFTCISDPNISQLTASLIEAYGAKRFIDQEIKIFRRMTRIKFIPRMYH
jgi:N-(2-amino-2-carboxyethyl)-L-glutamate synthase